MIDTLSEEFVRQLPADQAAEVRQFKATLSPELAKTLRIPKTRRREVATRQQVLSLFSAQYATWGFVPNEAVGCIEEDDVETEEE